MKAGDLNMMKSFKSLQGSLRALCLDAGSGLVYTSAVNDLNCIKLQKYMLQSLYKEDIKLTLNTDIEEGIATAFIPANKDSNELIATSTGISAADVLKHQQESMMPTSVFEEMTLQNEQQPASTSSAADSSSNKEERTLENEQDWLSRLKKFIALAEATTSGQPSASSTVESTKAVGDLGGKASSENSLSALAEDQILSDGAGSTGNNNNNKPESKPKLAGVSRRSSRVAGRSFHIVHHSLLHRMISSSS